MSWGKELEGLGLEFWTSIVSLTPSIRVNWNSLIYDPGTISSIPLEDPGVDHILAHDLESVAGYVLYDRARDVVANLNHGLHQEIDVHGFQGGIQEPVSPLIFDPGPDGFYWVEKGGSDWEKKKDRTH